MLIKLAIEFIPMPPEQEAAYWAAIGLIAILLESAEAQGKVPALSMDEEAVAVASLSE